MAQKVGVHDANVFFKEGPFVILFDKKWKIGAQLGHHTCAYDPDMSIDRLVKRMDFDDPQTEEDAAKLCDALNAKARDGEIVNKKGAWICPRYSW